MNKIDEEIPGLTKVLEDKESQLKEQEKQVGELQTEKSADNDQINQWVIHKSEKSADNDQINQWVIH